MEKVSLLEMKKGQKGKVSEILSGKGLYTRMMGIGIYEGRDITKVSHFGLRGPVTIKVGRNVLALSHGMAGKVIVKVEK